MRQDYFDRSSAYQNAIVKACYKRDQDEAVKLTSSHIIDAGKTLEGYLQKM